MNTGRFVVVVVWAAQVVLNFLIYGVAMMSQYEAWMNQYAGLLREGIIPFIVSDLLLAALLVYLWVKAGAAFGPGAKGGAIGGA